MRVMSPVAFCCVRSVRPLLVALKSMFPNSMLPAVLVN